MRANHPRLTILPEFGPRVKSLPLPPPRPRVAVPESRQQMQRCILPPAIRYRDPDADIIRRRLRVFHEHVEVTALVEASRIDQLELGVAPVPSPILVHQLSVRKCALWILVERLHVRVRRCRVEVVVALLHILAVVAFRTSESEQPLLEYGIAAVPERQRERETTLPVADAEQSVLAPAIRAAARMVVGKMLPAVTALRIILTHRAPLPLGEIRTPSLPVAFTPGILGETLQLGIQRRVRWRRCHGLHSISSGATRR